MSTSKSKAQFVSFETVCATLRGKTVAVVGSAPSVLENEPGFVDSHDVVVRANNYKTGPHCGYRCDVHYSYYGNAIKKLADDLLSDGVRLMMCKCPDAKPIESDWHERRGKQIGIDFRWIYRKRADWWPCDVWIPTVATFLEKFEMLDRHVPTTGFAAVLDVLAANPKSLFMTGFDFFTSGIHNVNEPWNEKNTGPDPDPIGHRPDLEAAWLAANADRYPLAFDKTLTRILAERRFEIMGRAA